MNVEKQIEFDRIRERWAELALTEWAKEKIRTEEICLEERALRKRLRDTTNARVLLEKLGTPPLQNLAEIRDVIRCVERGDCLGPYQLERVESFLAGVRRLKEYLSRGKSFDNPLAYYEEELDALEELRAAIGSQILRGMVDDHASKDLYRIRYEITKCEEEMKRKADQILRANQAYMADSYCTLRNGRLCLPVRKEYRIKVAGTVVDKSATGNTLFMEPAAVSEYYEELQFLRIDEENEVRRILYSLTAMTADSAAVIQTNLARIEKLDFLFSKGKLSMELDAVEPSVNTGRRILLKDARHPLLDRKTNVPLQFEIGEKIRGIVITGPNTGGKTVAIKTVVLSCMMAQCGLHVACREADICMNDAYLCDIGDGQDVVGNLSTFSAHIKNVLEVLREASEESLVILDELGSGTDPAEGMGIAVAVLEELRKSGAFFLVTTHYPEVKEYADRKEDVRNARMTFDRETLRPTYQMVLGEAGESCAFYIADRLGMPEEMLRTAAKAAYGEAAAETYRFRKKDPWPSAKKVGHISRDRKADRQAGSGEIYRRGDSVMVYPDKKIGIVCEPVNEKGVLRVQLPGRKIWINHKRVKLHVAAAELYPEDYDFSILFDTVKHRKIRHDMERKYTEEVIRHEPGGETDSGAFGWR